MKAIVKMNSHSRCYGDNPNDANNSDFKECAVVRFEKGDEWEIDKRQWEDNFPSTTLVQRDGIKVLLLNDLFEQLFEVEDENDN